MKWMDTNDNIHHCPLMVTKLKFLTTLSQIRQPSGIAKSIKHGTKHE